MLGSKPRTALQPVRILVGLYLIVILVTYATGWARNMFPDEARNATRLVIETFALAGIALVAADAIQSRERLNVLLQRLVYGAAFMGLVGDIEFMTKFNLATYIQVPGLSVNDQLIAIGSRGTLGFARVAGTASHYIEFGVVLGMLVPLAIHFAIFAPTRGRRQFNWLLVFIMAIGVPFAVSRAAAIALVVSVVVVAACWTGRARLNAILAAVLLAIGMKAAKPGLIGTIRGLFIHAGTDTSITSRTDDYRVAFQLIGERPLLGRGAGTFIPSRYRFLDKQILMTTIESGVVGLIALVALLLGGAALAHRVGKFASYPETKHLGYVLLGAFTVAALTSFTFDSLSFPIFAIVLFLLLGVAGAMWRLERPARHARFMVDSLASEAAPRGGRSRR
jgi:O-antigen ligase